MLRDELNKVDASEKNYIQNRNKVAREYFSKMNYELPDEDMEVIKETTMYSLYRMDKLMQKQRIKCGLKPIDKF